MNIEKYKNDGWGLSKKCFQDLYLILSTLKNKKINIVEFGSGISTEFLLDSIVELNIDAKLISFDNDVNYSYKKKNENLELNIVNLIECDDIYFNDMFYNKKIDNNFFRIKKTIPTTRQRNCFYDIRDYNFDNTIDIMILDGPHGNGRSLSFLFLKNHLKLNSIVVIDDYNHYDFIKRFEMIYPKYEIISESTNIFNNKWDDGDNYKILKII